MFECRSTLEPLLKFARVVPKTSVEPPVGSECNQLFGAVMGKRPGVPSEAVTSSSEGSTRAAFRLRSPSPTGHDPHRGFTRLAAVGLGALVVAALPLAFGFGGGTAFAAIVPTVPLATSANYAV